MTDTGLAILIVIFLILILGAVLGCAWYLGKVAIPRSQRRLEESMTPWPEQEKLSPPERDSWSPDDWSEPRF